jgi:DNA-binding response OmpR family regulator
LPHKRTRAPLAVVFARRSLSAYVALVLRHCGIEAQVTAAADRTEALVADRPPELLIVDAGRGPMAARLLGLAGEADRATIALIDLDRGASSLVAFGLGADQVVRVPFTPDELAVRTAQVLRRLCVATPFVRNLELSGLELSLDEYALAGARTIPLGPAQNSLLYLLMANAGRRVSRADVRRLAWGFDRAADDATVDRAVVRLRGSLGTRGPVHIASTRDGVTACALARPRPMRSLHDAPTPREEKFTRGGKRQLSSDRRDRLASLAGHRQGARESGRGDTSS